MKRLFVVIIAFVLFSIVNGQSQTTTQLSKENYLEKSRKQKRLAKGLLIGGIASGVVGSVIWKENLTLRGKASTEESLGAVLILGGTIAVLASIPTFISSARNKRKATGMTYEYRPLQMNSVLAQGSREHALVFRVSIK